MAYYITQSKYGVGSQGGGPIGRNLSKRVDTSSVATRQLPLKGKPRVSAIFTVSQQNFTIFWLPLEGKLASKMTDEVFTNV